MDAFANKSLSLARYNPKFCARSTTTQQVDIFLATRCLAKFVNGIFGSALVMTWSVTAGVALSVKNSNHRNHSPLLRYSQLSAAAHLNWFQWTCAVLNRLQKVEINTFHEVGRGVRDGKLRGNDGRLLLEAVCKHIRLPRHYPYWSGKEFRECANQGDVCSS